MRSYFPILILVLSLNVFAADEGEEMVAEAAEQEQKNDTQTPPPKLKPDEKAAVVVQKTEVQVKVADVAPGSSWRCANIPDEAFSDLGAFRPGSKSVTKVDWHRRATEFVAQYASRCPNFAALEKELPPWLSKKPYLDMFAVLFDLNRSAHAEKLFELAREDEVVEHWNVTRKKRQKMRDPAAIQKMSDQHETLVRKAMAAKLLLDVKHAAEVKARREANSISKRFIAEYLDRSGNVKSENIPGLKKGLMGLNPEQKKHTKAYLRDLLNYREYPRAELLPSKIEEAERAKENRGIAYLTRKEAGLRAAVQIMLFELE